MKNRYRELRERQQSEFNKFPIKYAFTDEQLKNGLKELGLKETDTDKVVSIGLGGGFVKKTDVNNLLKMVKKHKSELIEVISKDKTGEGFIKEMFLYELGNREYCITRELDETIDACRINNRGN